MLVQTNIPDQQPYVDIVNNLMLRTHKYICRRYAEEGPHDPDLSNACWLLGREERRAIHCCSHCTPFKNTGPDDDRFWGLKVFWVEQRSFSRIVEDAEHPPKKPAPFDARLY